MPWRFRRDLAPLKVHFALVFVTGSLFFWLSTDHDGRSTIAALGFGLFVAAVGTACVAVARRREQARIGVKGPADWSALIRAMYTGHAPADTSLDEGLLTMAGKRRTELRRWPWIISVMALLFLVFAIAQPQANLILGAVLSGTLSIGTWIERVQGVPRLSRLEETLRAR
jgi:hypothetical protein